MPNFADPFVPHGKKALVTGGARGIGMGACEALASAGCDLVLADVGDPRRTRQACERLAGEFGVQVHGLQVDVGDPAPARAAVREAARLLYGLDIVVCNAGICTFRPVLEITDEEWQRHLDTNLSGTFYVAQEAARIMVAQGTGGRLIFTTSVAAFRANGTQTHYGATKGGQNLLMQGMALELGGHGITVNSIAPGWIHTDINDAQSRDAAITAPWIKAHAPVGRLGTPADLQAAFLFLASRGASYVTGTSVSVDGGWLAQL